MYPISPTLGEWGIKEWCLLGRETPARSSASLTCWLLLTCNHAWLSRVLLCCSEILSAPAARETPPPGLREITGFKGVAEALWNFVNSLVPASDRAAFCSSGFSSKSVQGEDGRWKTVWECAS